MKNKKLLLILILIVILLIAIICLALYFSRNTSLFFMSKRKIKEIAKNDKYEIQDKQIKQIYNEILGDGTVIVSKENANTLEYAQNLANEYKDKVNNGISNKLNKYPYDSPTDFEYIDLIETPSYYKYIGEYTYKYYRTSDIIENYSETYSFLIFKSDYFEYPYLKKYSTISQIKEFGDILAVFSYNKFKIVKSLVEDKEDEFIYNVYWINSYSELEVTDPDTYYFLHKSSFTVNKSTGETSLGIRKRSIFK